MDVVQPLWWCLCNSASIGVPMVMLRIVGRCVGRCSHLFWGSCRGTSETYQTAKTLTQVNSVERLASILFFCVTEVFPRQFHAPLKGPCRPTKPLFFLFILAASTQDTYSFRNPWMFVLGNQLVCFTARRTRARTNLTLVKRGGCLEFCCFFTVVSKS